jgi:tRNA (guanine-N7-)-methyltransferase
MPATRMPRVRIHQHVNPLSPHYRQEPKPIDLGEVFAVPSNPLHLDIGCARGRFLLRMAEADADQNFLGVEIREPLVDEANRLAREAGLENLHYSFCNAMIWLSRLLESVPDSILRTVSIQFPDPWFKKKHSKRRMVTPELVGAIAAKLATHGTIFIQSDIEILKDEICALIRSDERLIEKVVKKSPFSIRTEREMAVENKSLPVYRAIFTKAAVISNSFLCETSSPPFHGGSSPDGR